MTFPYGEARAFVERDFGRDRVRIHLAVKTGDERMHVLHDDGTIRTYEPGETATTPPLERPWLTLTDGLARKLLDELAAYYGGVSETRSLRKDYDSELGRVDRLIGIMANGRDGGSK